MKTLKALATLALFLGMTSYSVAQQANQSVTVDVDAINELAVSGDPANLVINSATAGSAPDNASDNSTTYDITTNEATKKIVGKLSAIYASGVSLAVSLGAPTGGTSAGSVTLTALDQDLVTVISNLAESGLSISYVASATVDAAPNAGETRTVTFTITS